MKYLGDSLELIACEKAGIAKPGVPFVIGETDATLVEVLRREARRAVGRADSRARADIRVLPPDYEWCGPLESGGAASAAQRGGGSGHPDGPAVALSPDRRNRSSAPSAWPGSPGGSTGEVGGCSTWPTTRTGCAPWLAALGRHPADAAPACAGFDSGRQGVARDAGAAGPGDRSWRAHDRTDCGRRVAGTSSGSAAGCAIPPGRPLMRNGP